MRDRSSLGSADVADGVRLRFRTGGDGAPVVLLHGHPRTHTTWHRVAPQLADVVELMQHLGHDRFAVVGHDRGSYVAYRLALDHPERITDLVVLDSVPIAEALDRADARFAQAWWHWFFLARPETPERVINADPEAWYGAGADLQPQRCVLDVFRALEACRPPLHGEVRSSRWTRHRPRAAA